MKMRGPPRKFTAEEVEMIRKLRAEGFRMRTIGEYFKISNAHIHRLCNGARPEVK